MSDAHPGGLLLLYAIACASHMSHPHPGGLLLLYTIACASHMSHPHPGGLLLLYTIACASQYAYSAVRIRKTFGFSNGPQDSSRKRAPPQVNIHGLRPMFAHTCKKNPASSFFLQVLTHALLIAFAYIITYSIRGLQYLSDKISTTGLAGGLLTPYKGLLPALESKDSSKGSPAATSFRSEEHTSELQSQR